MDWDWICSYYTPKWRGSSRSSPDALVNALGKFYDEYTDTKLEKVGFQYYPNRLSDEGEYTPEAESLWGSWRPCPPETDEEVNKTLEYIQGLRIITEAHWEKTPEMYERHEYEIDISSFNELYALLKTKTDTSSTYAIALKNEFNFIDYDYSEFEKVFSWHKSRKYANRIWIFGGNGVEFGRQPGKKYTAGVDSLLYFPVFTEKERSFLKYIEKTLKIKFSSNGFSFFYKTDKGKVRSKKHKVIL